MKDSLLKEKLGSIPERGYIVASYPRSGSLWIRSLLFDYETLTAGRGVNPEQAAGRAQYSPRLELPNFTHLLSEGSQEFSRQVITTHFVFDSWKTIAPDKSILMVFREPADSFVSAYRKRTVPHFVSMRLSPQAWAEQRKRILDQGIDQFSLSLCDEWTKHSKSFLNAFSDGYRIKFVSYESMKDRTALFLGSIVEFFNYRLSARYVEAAIENRQIERVKTSMNTPNWNAEIGSGQVGASRECLKSTTISSIKAKTGDVLRQLRAFEVR